MIWKITFYDDLEHRQIAYSLSFDDSSNFLRVANSLKKSLSNSDFMHLSFDAFSGNPFMDYHICRYSDLRNSVKRIQAIYEELKNQIN